MNVFTEVVIDLFSFARQSLASFFMEQAHHTQVLPDATPSASLQSSTDILHINHSLRTLVLGEQYFVGHDNATLHYDPTYAFDNVVKQLAYTQTVRLVALQGRWAQVRVAGVVGWVLKDVLYAQQSDVYPQFTPGVIYDATHPETKKLRTFIHDMFHACQAGADLSPAEYVQYQLMQKRKYIDWGDMFLRMPGTWQKKLAGRTGIYIGITPKTHSVMEYIVDDVGHLAFVHAAFSDGTIQVSEMGKYDDATYTMDSLTHDQWKELRPVFIEVL